MSADTDTQSQHRFTNALIHEKSPYLLQHAHNPVNWHAWGPEALERAKAEDKPIFLSVGYSACHWCHVMERESFENEAIAKALNDRFVSIKVDREERPDIDEIYMTAVQMMIGQGGWPMSMFLTPDGRPFYGGTYFPPENRYGRIGFGSLLLQLDDAWKTRRDEVEEIANNVSQELRTTTRQRPIATTEEGPVNPNALLRSAVDDLAARFDEDNGGFNEGGPKFPPHHALRLLLTAIERGDSEISPRLAITTLDKMALSGIYDHIGGGFHRYATDAVWLLPHFEKMLYDNALLARVFAQAYVATGRRAYARIAREACAWVLRDMEDAAGGGFHAALDADSEGEEGKYYVWTKDEVREILGESKSEVFSEQYNILPGGNWREEATGRLTGTNIPHLAAGLAATVSVILPDTLGEEIEADRAALLDARNRRVPPGKDDKVITAWNGLMIGALATAGSALREPRYREAARAAAEFCLTTLRPNGELLRRYARGEAAHPAFLDDYAFLADGLMDLYEATGDAHWLAEARSLVDTLLERFWDSEDGGFFFVGSGNEPLIAASKDLFDNALPSPNGVAIRVLARLGKTPEGERYGEKAREMLTAYHGLMLRAPQGTPTLILAALDAFAGSEAGALPTQDVPVTLASETTSPLRLNPGEKSKAIFVLRIASGYHVNANRPEQEYLVPTVASITSDLPAAVGPVAYPDPISWEFGGETLATYQGEAVFTLPIDLAVDAAPGTYELTLTVEFQACSESACLAPDTRSLSITVEIA